MNKIKYIFFIIISIFSVMSCSQMSYLKKATKQYNKSNYYLASVQYKHAINKGNNISEDNNLRIANSFYYIKNYKAALKFFNKVDKSKRDGISQLNYARILQFNEAFSKAKQAFIDLKKIGSKQYSDSTINKFIESCNLAINNTKPTKKQYKITKSDINVYGESFGVCFYNNGILYSAPVKTTQNFIVDVPVDKYGNTFKNIFFSNISDKGKILDSLIFIHSANKKHHIGSVSYLPDSNRFYFSETIKETQIPVIKIFSIDKKGDKFVNLKELSFNSNSYSCAHPSISSDGKTLFFTSNMDGGYGETDIYSSNFENGKWTKPKNLGNEVNTEATEMFPYIKENGVLYFSSDGKIGFGGLDIYYALNEAGKWTHIVHKNKPLNSSADDFAYAENVKNNNQIYISSNRNSKPGLDNIYFVEKLDLPPNTIKGRLVDNLTDMAIDSATLSLHTDSVLGNTIAKAVTDKNGNYSLIIPKKREDETEEHLFTVIKKEGYEDKVIEFEGRYSDTDRPPLTNIDVAMKITIIEEQVIELHNVYFDYGKADLKNSSMKVLDKIIEVMQENPNMKIQLSAFTDSKSSKRFNQKLSEKRANSAKNYMLSKIVDHKRIVAKGYGETHLLNHCKDGVDCSDKEHAINRRIEVKVLSN